MAPNGTRKTVRKKKSVFILTLVKSFSCQSFKQNYFLSQIEWVGLGETASKIALRLAYNAGCHVPQPMELDYCNDPIINFPTYIAHSSILNMMHRNVPYKHYIPSFSSITTMILGKVNTMESELKT